MIDTDERKKNLMKKSNTIEATAKLGSVENACMRYGLGRSSMREIGKAAGAVVHVGRRFLLNYSILDKYFDDLSGDGKEN